MISRIYITALFTCMVSLVLVEPGNKKEQDACEDFAVNPFFEPKMVLGPQWRIYYKWNLKEEINCLAMKFHSVNPSILRRFHKDMGPYLAEQPLWAAPILFMTVGAAKEEMLLFASFGPQGSVHGVPYLTRHPNFEKNIKKKLNVPLMRYQMKLVHGGQYLGVMDCLRGSVTLSTRDLEVPPSRSEIDMAAKKLAIGPGSLACNKLRNATRIPDYDSTDERNNVLSSVF